VCLLLGGVVEYGERHLIHAHPLSEEAEHVDHRMGDTTRTEITWVNVQRVIQRRNGEERVTV
jgi:hypothetical protein